VKVIERGIFPFQEKEFFSPIRNKIDYARLVVLAARQLLLNSSVEGAEITSRMKLIVDKMSRLFFYKDKKYFSISFPFTTQIDGDDIIEITSYSGKNLNNKSISAVIAILDNEQFKLNPSLIDHYIEPNGIESSGLFLLEEIFQSEPSYIRYDIDSKNENGILHPLHHFDVNYSSYGTYKLGLNKNIPEDYFESTLNILTECVFVTDKK